MAPPLPASRLLICVCVPVIVTNELPLALTPAPVLPPVTFSVPSVTDSVTVSEPEPASTSLIDRPVPCSVKLVCSFTGP